jgi:antitoxin component YwqK of YwqJK toxin-antitoxin module
MRYILSLILILSVSTIYSQRKINYNKLEAKESLMYVIGENEPYTGKCYTQYDGGQLGMGGSYLDGKMEGDWIWWYENGKKKRYTQYKTGTKNGKSIFWYKTGIKKSEIIYDNNRNIRQISYNKKGEKVANPSMSKFR